jgi:hypothetical protein
MSVNQRLRGVSSYDSSDNLSGDHGGASCA